MFILLYISLYYCFKNIASSPIHNIALALAVICPRRIILFRTKFHGKTIWLWLDGLSVVHNIVAA